MQKVVFDRYGVDEDKFWSDCRKRSQENQDLFGQAHGELDYMNTFLWYTKCGPLVGIDNTTLAELGNDIVLYPGVSWMFNELFKLGIEIYIVSAGIKTMLSGLESRIQKESGNPDFKINGIFAGDFRCDEYGCKGITSIATCMDTIGKTKTIYEISKGCNIHGYDFTVSLPQKSRRIPLESMIYVGDGYSDVPAMNLISGSGGFTLGVFDPKNRSQFEQIEQIRCSGRLSVIACADYTEGSTAATWLINKSAELLYINSEIYTTRREVEGLRENKLRA
jgi:hypothetical protein